MRVIVCGGRDYEDKATVFSTLDRVLAKYGDELVIVTGSCPTGADFLAEKWAKSREVEYMGFPARWKRLSKAAGRERNTRMRDKTKPDAGIAFPGGTGTAMMCELLEEIGIKPWRVTGIEPVYSAWKASRTVSVPNGVMSPMTHSLDFVRGRFDTTEMLQLPQGENR